MLARVQEEEHRSVGQVLDECESRRSMRALPEAECACDRLSKQIRIEEGAEIDHPYAIDESLGDRCGQSPCQPGLPTPPEPVSVNSLDRRVAAGVRSSSALVPRSLSGRPASCAAAPPATRPVAGAPRRIGNKLLDHLDGRYEPVALPETVSTNRSRRPDLAERFPNLHDRRMSPRRPNRRTHLRPRDA